MRDGRYDVVNPEAYQEITGFKGDTPDQIHIHPVQEQSHTVEEIWTSNWEGRTKTLSVDTVRELVDGGAISNSSP